LGFCKHFYEASDIIKAGNSLSVSVITEELFCSTDIYLLCMYTYSYNCLFICIVIRVSYQNNRYNLQFSVTLSYKCLYFRWAVARRMCVCNSFHECVSILETN